MSFILHAALAVGWGHLRGTRARIHLLAHACGEVLPGGAVTLEGVRRDHLETPGNGAARGVLDVHLEIRMRVLPDDTRQRPLQVEALGAVELDVEAMVDRKSVV